MKDPYIPTHMREDHTTFTLLVLPFAASILFFLAIILGTMLFVFLVMVVTGILI